MRLRQVGREFGGAPQLGDRAARLVEASGGEVEQRVRRSQGDTEYLPLGRSSTALRSAVTAAASLPAANSARPSA